tara:strand:+ start:96 stop:593 length:498 start_codon:yes stop_codon:yes gene_type:complete
MKKLLVPFCLTLIIFIGSAGVSESADCDGLTADLPESMRDGSLILCKENAAKAKKGDVDAIFYFGEVYSQDKKYSEAVKWWSLAAEKQHYRSLQNIAYAYAFFLKDDVRSLMWLNLMKNTEQWRGDTTAKNVYMQLRNRMNVQQIEKAQELARECVLKEYKGCVE